MQLQFLHRRKSLTVDPRTIRRLRWVSQGSSEPVAIAVLTDGRVGRFLSISEISDYVRCLAADVEEHSYPVISEMLPGITVKDLQQIISARFSL